VLIAAAIGTGFFALINDGLSWKYQRYQKSERKTLHMIIVKKIT